MTIVPTALPYARYALQPHISESEETIDSLSSKNHKSDVDKLNGPIAGTGLAHQSLEDIVRGSDGSLAIVNTGNDDAALACERP